MTVSEGNRNLITGSNLSSPLITVGITCYNAEHSIQRALRSALDQDWPNLEVVVVDDASIDQSWAQIEAFANEVLPVRAISHEVNQGAAAARNSILKAASGKFIAFFDDDDLSRPDRLRLQHKHIADYEKAAGTQFVACYASGERVYPNGYTLPLRAVGSDGSPPTGSAMADYLLFNRRDLNLFYGTGTPTCSLMARTSLFRELGGFDTAMRRQEDVDFAIRLSLKGGHFIGIPEPVLTQYATGGSEKSALIEFESFLRLLDKNKDYLISTNSYHYMRLWSEMRYYHFAGKDGQAFLLLKRLLLAYPIRTVRHFLHSATRRFRHERRMNASSHG
jgi:glycosyltransferase involved in cell wall biosynthesis